MSIDKELPEPLIKMEMNDEIFFSDKSNHYVDKLLKEILKKTGNFSSLEVLEESIF